MFCAGAIYILSVRDASPRLCFNDVIKPAGHVMKFIVAESRQVPARVASVGGSNGISDRFCDW